MTKLGSAMPLVDANGMTEREFLAAYKQKNYPKPALTADICVFSLGRRASGESARGSLQEDGVRLLLVKRGNHPCLGMWALPGGFVNPRETADCAAERELAEETGVQGLKLERVGLYSDPDRDPRGWTVSEAFLAVDDEGRIPQAGDDAAEAAWFLVRENKGFADCMELALLSEWEGGASALVCFRRRETAVTGAPYAGLLHSENLAFDHAQIIADAYLRLGEAIDRRDDASKWANRH